MWYLSPYHQPVLNSAKFRENVEIPRKQANFAAQLKIPCSVEKCDLSSHNLGVEDATELALERLLWRSLAASGATH